jgi:CRP-like cAMP-binding protein
MSSKRSSTVSWHITRILRESFRGLHKQPPLSRKKKVMTQQYVKFVYKGQYYRRPIIPRNNYERQPPQLLKIPAQPLGVPKSFKEPPKLIQSEKAALVGNSQQSNKQQTWSWKSWFTLNTPLLILNFGSMATLLAFTRSDVLELRTLALTGNCTFVIYSLISPPIKWPAICWSMLFASVNGFNIAKILNERKGKVVLTPHEMEIYQEHFQPYGVTQFQFYKVVTMGHTKIIPAGEIIARQGAPITSVKLVVRGKTRASVGGRHLTAIGSSKGNRFRNVGGDSGAWIGEMAFLQTNWDKDHQAASANTTSDGVVITAVSSGEGDTLRESLQKKVSGEGRHRPTSTISSTTKSSSHEGDTDSTTTTTIDPIRFMSTIVAVEEVEIIEWSFEEMQKLLKISNDMQGALTRAMTAAIVGKVVNFMVSRQAALPQWTTLLDNWRAIGPLRVDRFVNVDEDDDLEDEEEEILVAAHDAKNKKRIGWIGG